MLEQDVEEAPRLVLGMVDAIVAVTRAVCGFRLDEETCLRECVDAGLAWQGSDLVVLMASAYLPEAENVVCIGMDHVEMHTHPVLAEAIGAVLDGAPVPEAIYASEDLRFDEEAASP